MAQSQPQLPGFETTYRVEWLYASQPNLDAAAIQEQLQSTLPESEVKELGFGYLVVVHRAHTAKFATKHGPAITAIFTVKDPTIAEAEVEAALQQTRTWSRDDASARVKRAQTRIVQMDLLSRNQPHQTRLLLIHGVARALALVTQPDVAYWHPAGWMVAPEQLTNDPLDAAMNVRLFKVDERPGELLMDTLGLAALGVPDIQCHFLGLDPGRVAGFLRDTGRYVFEKGDVIKDGHTVQGLEPAHKWACRHEMAFASPARAVIDINPGPPHSARSLQSASGLN